MAKMRGRFKLKRDYYKEYWEELYYRMEVLATQCDDIPAQECAKNTLEHMRSIKRDCKIDLDQKIQEQAIINQEEERLEDASTEN